MSTEVKEKEISNIPPAFTEEELKNDPSSKKSNGLQSAFPEEELETKLTLENFDVEENGDLIALTQPEKDSETDEDKENSESDEKTPLKEKSQEEPKEEKPKEEAKTEVTEPVFSQEVLNRASQAGITIETARRFGSEQELNSFLNRFDQPKEEPKQETKQEDDEYVPLENEDDYDPEFVKMHKERFELRKEIKELKNQQQSVQDYERQRNQERLLNDFDSMVKKTPEEFKDYLGEEEFKNISPGTDHYRNRERVMQEMVAIRTGYVQSGMTPPSMQELYDRSINALFPDAVKKAAQKELETQLKKDSGKTLHRPGGRATNTNSQLSGEDRAVQKSIEFDRMHNLL